MKQFGRMMLAGCCSLSVACGGETTGGGGKGAESPAGRVSAKAPSAGAVRPVVSKQAARAFERALETFVEHDKKQDWNESSCTSVAKQFADAAEEQKGSAGRALPEALYNAGMALQRCGKEAEAREKFEAALRADAGFHRARSQLALYDLQRSNDIDSTIRQLDQIIRDAKFQNVEALVSLAALQMERGNDQPDQDGKNDLERAQRNLQRALAIDDGYMPAFNQLAVYYLEQAKAKAGAGISRRGRRGLEVSGVKRLDIDEQQLDLAALVASQAQRKNPNYAPIHNTTGLILVELKNFNGAVKSFGRARQLDPKFFEAQMNYAAVNLSFRGFEEAEKAYRDALKLRSKEYEAHLGLALALRGQINDANFDKFVPEAQQHLDEAKKLAPDRPETYYNEGILTHEYRAKRAKPVPMLQKAAEQYRQFIEKAGSEPTFAAAVKRAKERTQDIDDTVKFLREGEEAAKNQPPAVPPPPPSGASPGSTPPGSVAPPPGAAPAPGGTPASPSGPAGASPAPSSSVPPGPAQAPTNAVPPSSGSDPAPKAGGGARKK